MSNVACTLPARPGAESGMFPSSRASSPWRGATGREGGGGRDKGERRDEGKERARGQEDLDCIPGDAEHGNKNQLIRELRPVARHTFPKVAPGGPGELRNCRKVAAKLPKTCRTVAPGDEVRLRSDQPWPMRRAMSARIRPTLTNKWPNSAKLRGCWPNLGRVWPKSSSKDPQY